VIIANRTSLQSYYGKRSLIHSSACPFILAERLVWDDEIWQPLQVLLVRGCKSLMGKIGAPLLQIMNHGQLKVFEAFDSSGFLLERMLATRTKLAHLTSLSLGFAGCDFTSCPVMPECRTKDFVRHIAASS
jgi:hypothetical protein